MRISMAFVIFYLLVHGMNNIKCIFIVTKQIAKHYIMHTDQKNIFICFLKFTARKKCSNTNYTSQKVYVLYQ